ncbi:DUF969 domain-containing protein, partial [Campylobacter jejuni]
IIHCSRLYLFDKRLEKTYKGLSDDKS